MQRTPTVSPHGRDLRRPAAFLRWLAVALAVVLPAVAWGVTTASAQASLGPHLARYDVTVDGEVTVDLGPLGTVVLDSPVPLGLGVRVVVQEIPRDLTAVGTPETLEALGRDLAGYVQFFSGPDAAVRVAVRALLLDAARRSLLAVVVLTFGLWAVRAAMGDARRAELAARFAPYRAATVGGTVLALVVGAGLTGSAPVVDRDRDPPPARVFDGTPLEGARITGRLAGVVDTYGGYLVDAYRSNEAFYDGAVVSVREAWERRAAVEEHIRTVREAMRIPQAAEPPALAPSEGDDAGTEQPSATATPSPGATSATEQVTAATPAPIEPPPVTATTATPTEAPTVPPTPAAEGAAPDEREPEPEREADERREAAAEEAPEPVVLLVISDLHCNVGMARVVAEVARLADVDVVLNAGDTTINGTTVESYCVEAFVEAVPDDATTVIADGNHDSAETSAQGRAAGAVVLDGEVVEVAGLRILGDSDPRATRIGSGTAPVGDETIAEAGRRLADVACADAEGVDLLLVHTPAVGDAALARGCVEAQVSGHTHKRVGPVRRGEGVRYVNSSTAGAVSGAATVGPLNGTAEMTLLRVDPETGEVLDHRLVTVSPDGEASVGFAVRWPRAFPEVVPSSEPR